MRRPDALDRAYAEVDDLRAEVAQLRAMLRDAERELNQLRGALRVANQKGME